MTPAEVGITEWTGPYSALHGLCANGHPVNGWGRCEELNAGWANPGWGQQAAPGDCHRAGANERARSDL